MLVVEQVIVFEELAVVTGVFVLVGTTTLNTD
jgi:hypothetical protein